MKELHGRKDKTLAPSDSEGGVMGLAVLGGMGLVSVGIVVLMASLAPVLGAMSAGIIAIAGYRWITSDDEEEADEVITIADTSDDEDLFAELDRLEAAEEAAADKELGASADPGHHEELKTLGSEL